MSQGDIAVISPKKVFWLSHPLAPDTPMYGGALGLQVERITSIALGDSANTLRLSLPNHVGTHVDLPAHFFDGARGCTDYSPDHWIFRRPCLVDVPLRDGLVGAEHLPADIPGDADLLLFRTGHGKSRGTDDYWRKGPGLAEELGLWIRARLPSVRAVGMDLISVTSRLRREEGRRAHRAFLDPAGSGSPVLLIEDMKLVDCPSQLACVVVSPLLVAGADGAPVTVWAM